MAEKNNQVQPEAENPIIENQNLDDPNEFAESEQARLPTEPDPAFMPEGLPEGPDQDPPPPATRRNVAETEKAIKAKEAKLFPPARIANIKKSFGYNDAQAKNYLLAEERRKASQRARLESEKIVEQKNQAKIRRAEIDDELAQLQQNIEYAESQGVTPPDLLEYRNALMDEKQVLDKSLEAVTPAKPEDVQKMAQPTQEDIREIAEPLRKQKAAVQVAEKNAARNAQRAIETKAKIENEIQQEDQQLQIRNFADFWQSRSTGGKIFAAIGMALGAAGQTLTGSQRNSFISAVNDSIDRSLKADQMNFRQQLAEKQYKLRETAEKIRGMQAQTDDRIKQAKLAALQQDIVNQGQLIRRRRELSARLEAGQEVPPELIPEDVRKEASSIRKEYNTELNRLATRELVGQYQAIKEAASAPPEEQGAADLTLIFSYMKILDPRSVVREGEFANAQNSGGVPDRIRAQYNRIVTGGRLSESQRSAFLSQASTVVENKLKQQEKVNERYSEIARASGIPSSLVVEKFENVFSPRERLIMKQLGMPKNKGMSRNQVEKSIDTLIDQGKLPGNIYGR